MKFPCFGEIVSISATRISENSTQQLIKLNHFLARLTRSHQFFDALQLFAEIHSSHRRPKLDHYTLSSAITACAHLRDAGGGAQLHAHAIRAGFRAFPHVGNPLLSLYAKCGDLNSVERAFEETPDPDVYSWTSLLSACTKLGSIGHARHVFDQMPQRSVAAWNAIITGCAETGDVEAALGLFLEMHQLGVRHDNYTFASVLSLCSLDMLDFGRQVHSLVVKTGSLAKASVVNAHLTMYFHSGNVGDACAVFEEAEVVLRDQITFNAMIAGLGSVGKGGEALIMFKGMQQARLKPTELTFVSLMSSCSSARVCHQLHGLAITMGFKDCTSVQNAAITMYSGFGNFNASHVVFSQLEARDIVSWNTIITSYAQANCYALAISAYLQMRRAGIQPDEFTVGSLLVGSESLEFIEMIQAFVYKNGLILNVQVSNALISAFSKHQYIEQAYQIFYDMRSKNLISWNCIISGLQLNGYPLNGLEHFYELLISDFRPNVFTLSLVLSICSNISALGHGKQVHAYILRRGYFSDTSLGNALITFYAKCGMLGWSLRVFDEMPERDTISWNALISAYAQHGEGKKAVDCFELLQRSCRVNPDQATFTAVLSACSRAGLINEGLRIFISMVNKCSFVPGADHVSCVVDLLSRAGYLDEAEKLLNSEHFEADSSIWWALFTSCASHGDLRLGRVVAEFLLEREQHNPTVYVQLSNIYAAKEQWEEAANVRELMKTNGAVKQPGCSWVRL